MARPTRYNKTLAEGICLEIMMGRSLRSICEDKDMPDKSTVCRWLADKNKSEFRDQYAYAREIQAEMMGDELLDIADDGTNDFVERTKRDGSVEVTLDKEAVLRSKLRVDARKWLMSKLKPKKYGDKITQELTGKGGGAIKTEDVTLDDEQRADRITAIFDKARARRDRQDSGG